jgi:hypothetical protein
MKGKFTAVLLIIVFVLLAAVIFTFLSSLDRKLSGTEIPTPPVIAAQTPAPQETPYYIPATPAPATPAPATPAPVLTPAPTLTPVTPLPTTAPTTVPVQTTLSSGSFSSDTGTWLNITADWSVTSLDQNKVQVTVSVSAVSYALHYTSFPRTLNISLDGQYVSLDPTSITYDGGEQAVHSLGTTSFTVDLPVNSSKAMTLQVAWEFNGEMGGPNGRMMVPVVECGGVINAAR